MRLVLIGGGENGRVKSNGHRTKYETRIIDEEIIKLSNIENPNILFIAHGMKDEEGELNYYNLIRNTYGKLLHSNLKQLLSSDLKNIDKVKELLDWSEVIYIGGGNTMNMLKLWKSYNFDNMILEYAKSKRVIAGLSAGANILSKKSLTDSLKDISEDNPFVLMDGLSLINIIFVPHANKDDKEIIIKELIKDEKIPTLLLSNCMSLFIDDDKYKLVSSISIEDKIKPYAKKVYYKDNKYVEELLEEKDDYESFSKI